MVDLSSSDFLPQLVSQTRDLDIGLLVSNAGDDASTAALQGTPFLANYAGAKSYLTGVNVTVVVPGPTKTPGMLEKPAIPLSKLPASAMSPADVARVGLSALARNKPYVIVGVMNKVIATMGSLIGRTGARNIGGALIKGIVPAPPGVR